jgi:hypothetical protein
MDAAAPLSARPAAGDALRRAERSFRAAAAHARRCRAAGPPPGDAEVARLVAAFHARGGAVTLCPPVHLLPTGNGTGSAAAPRAH